MALWSMWSNSPFASPEVRSGLRGGGERATEASSSSHGALSPPLEAEGIAALQRSLQTLTEQLADANAALLRLSEENTRKSAECTRLRSELNDEYAKKAGAMMDVAMAASTQILADEAAFERRARAEASILASELGIVEGALFADARSQLPPRRSEPPFSSHWW
jgi:hypothetical protein